MQILVDNPTYQTFLFGIFFLLILILSVRKSTKSAFFSTDVTQELKGFAMLAIIFSHIGYFLSTDPRFLYPFSVLAGVGVNLFLFLSGFGLTLSELKTGLSVSGFYKKRLVKLFLPLWLVIFLLVILDLLILKRSYPMSTILQSLLGFAPVADIFKSLDSPLWYFTFILFYYLTFPLFFWKKIPYLCPILILLFSFFLLQLPLPIDKDVLNLYKLHWVSFPLGVLFALLIEKKNPAWKLSYLLNFKYFLALTFVLVFGYTSIHSGVGEDKLTEQATSLITMFSLVLISTVKRIEVKFLYWFGVYSYEIYLIHWPILSRYDLLYKNLPAFLATLLYLGLFLILGYLLNKLTRKLLAV